MGLGKTVQVAVLLGVIARLWKGTGVGAPFLVFCPLSLLEQWRRELEKWAPELEVVVLQGKLADRQAAARYEWSGANSSAGRGRAPTSLRPGELPVRFDVCLATYDTLLRTLSDNPRRRGSPATPTGLNFFASFPWSVCVLDECTRMKSTSSTLRREYAAVVRPWVDYHVLLTGTPIQNDISELWSLLNLADPSRFANSQDFEARFGDLSGRCQAGCNTGAQLRDEAADRVQALRCELEACVLQRKKADVLPHLLPPHDETIINVELSFDQKQLYRAILERNLEALRRCSSNGLRSFRGASVLNISMELRKVCNHPFLVNGAEVSIAGRAERGTEAWYRALVESSSKMAVLEKLLRKADADGQNVLVFSQFTMMLDLLEDMLQWLEFPFERLDGQVSLRRRNEALDRFRRVEDEAGPAASGEARGIEASARARPRVFLLSTRAGGLGLNLTAASVCVLFDCDWNPQNDLQAMARCHRIGQQKDVSVYRLVTKRTYEAGMFRVASQKLGLTEAILEGAGAGAESGAAGPPAAVLERLLRHGAFAAFDVEDQDARRADVRSFDEILLSEDAVLLRRAEMSNNAVASAPSEGEPVADATVGCEGTADGAGPNNTSHCGSDSPSRAARPGSSQFASRRFRKVFFSDGHCDEQGSQIPGVDDPDFWEKVALRSSRVQARARDQEAQKRAMEIKLNQQAETEDVAGTAMGIAPSAGANVRRRLRGKSGGDRMLAVPATPAGSRMLLYRLQSGPAKGWIVQGRYSFASGASDVNSMRLPVFCSSNFNPVQRTAARSH